MPCTCYQMVPDFLITHASESFFALTGYTKDEIIGQSCTRFMEGKDTDPVRTVPCRCLFHKIIYISYRNLR